MSGGGNGKEPALFSESEVRFNAVIDAIRRQRDKALTAEVEAAVREQVASAHVRFLEEQVRAANERIADLQSKLEESKALSKPVGAEPKRSAKDLRNASATN